MTSLDPTIIHCPLAFCQAPVKAPKAVSTSTSASNGDASSDLVNTKQNADLGEYSIGWQKLRTCDACGFSFCMFCKKAWYVHLINPSLSLSNNPPNQEYLFISCYVSFEGTVPSRAVLPDPEHPSSKNTSICPPRHSVVCSSRRRSERPIWRKWSRRIKRMR